MKRIVYVVVGVALLAVTIAGAGSVLADTKNPGTLAQAIATKFHLNSGEVQGVIDQQHQQNQADRQAKLKAKLDQAVKDGKLTQTQEDTLVQKLGTLDQNRQADRTDKQNLHQWLDDNKIDLREILGPMPGPIHGGRFHKLDSMPKS